MMKQIAILIAQECASCCTGGLHDALEQQGRYDILLMTEASLNLRLLGEKTAVVILDVSGSRRSQAQLRSLLDQLAVVGSPVLLCGSEPDIQHYAGALVMGGMNYLTNKDRL